MNASFHVVESSQVPLVDVNADDLILGTASEASRLEAADVELGGDGVTTGSQMMGVASSSANPTPSISSGAATIASSDVSSAMMSSGDSVSVKNVANPESSCDLMLSVGDDESVSLSSSALASSSQQQLQQQQQQVTGVVLQQDDDDVGGVDVSVAASVEGPGVDETPKSDLTSASSNSNSSSFQLNTSC